MKNRLLLRSALAALLALLNACGGGSDSPSNPDTPAITAVAAGQQASQTLGAAGGTVQLATREGARFTLTVPAGAVPEGTLLALETAAPAAGRRLHLRLSPAGLVPAMPLELTLVLPQSMALPSGAALVYDRAPLPFTRRADGSLQLRLPALAGGSAIAAGAGRALALAAPQQAASPVPACSGVPVLDTTPDGGLADSAPIVADDYGSCMLGAVNALATSGEYAEAVRLASSIGAYLQSIGAANTDGLSTRFLTEARSLACTAYGRVIDAAAAATVTSYDGLVPLVKPVLLWEMAVQQLGAVCPGVAPGRYLTVVENLTSAALGFYTSQQGTVVDVASPAYAQALRETRAGNATVAQVRSLDAPAALQTLARTQIRERAQPALLSSVLQAPWQRCRDSGNFDKLIELMQLMDQPAAVKTAAQYCATQLSAQAKDPAGAVTATLDAQLGGVSAGEQRTGGTLAVTVDGKLDLIGPIRALQCPAGSNGGSESLQLKLGGAVLQTITAAPYLPDTLQVDIAQALRAAGIAASTFSSAALTLSRSGSPCGGFWGDNPEPLLTLTLQGRGCTPEAGRNYCVTVLADLDSSERDFSYPHAISNQGGHVVVGRTDATGAYKLSIWQRGQVSALPDGFTARVNTGHGADVFAVADDGAVAGLKEVYQNGQLTEFMPAVFRPADNRVVDLLPTAVKAFEWITPSSSNYRLQRQLWSLSLSPQGRITFTLIEKGASGWADSDLGFCGLVQLSSGSAYDCFRYTRYEASPGATGPATEQQTLRAPNTGELQFPTFDGGSGVGRVGHADELAAQTGRQGEITRYSQRFDNRLARDLVTLTPQVTGTAFAADRQGRTVALLNGTYTLLPAQSGVPSGWTVGSLGLEGHLQVCSADGQTTRLLELDSGRTLIELGAGSTHTHQGRSLQLRAACAASDRLVDAQGRMLGVGWIEAAGREVPVVYTPAGVALP